MNAKLLSSPLRTLKSGLVLGCVLFSLFAARSSAVTLTSSFTLPVNYSFGIYTESNPTLGTFNFAYTGNVLSFAGTNITLTFLNLDTNAVNQPTNGTAVGLDYNNITLALGGIDTGIILNGFGNGLDTQTFTQTPNNSAAIITALNLNHSLSVGLIDHNGISSGTNPFALTGATVNLSLTGAVVEVPFTPVQTLGYGLIALVVAWRRFRWANPFAMLTLARVAR